MEQTGFEWEQCKENVKPIRIGRSVSKIMNSLNCPDYNNTLREQRRVYENDLRTYKGDDPLDVWSRYIKWTEESFWQGGKESLMFELVEKCVRRFNNIDCNPYADDARLLDIWIQFVSFCKEPLSVFKYLYQRNYFLKLSKFYLFWAAYTEQLNTADSAAKHVDSIFTKGIENQAVPLDNLKQHHEKFLLRSVMRQSTARQDDLRHVDMEIEASLLPQQRVALTSLCELRDLHAPVNRVPQRAARPMVLKSTKATYSALQMVCENNLQPLAFTVAEDPDVLAGGHQEPSFLAPSNRAPQILTSENDRENLMAPGKWKHSKIKSNKKPRNRNAIHILETPVKSTFKIFSDNVEDVNQDIEKPKMSETKKNLLSLRKQNKVISGDVFESFLTANAADNGPKFSFEYDLLYGGVEEFSFEEISAAHWFMVHKDDNELLTKIQNCSLDDQHLDM